MFNYLVIAALLAVSMSKAVRYTALLFLSFQIIFMVFIKGMSWDVYFVAVATVNLVAGRMTYDKNVAFAKLSFLMIPVAFIGFVLCYHRLSLVAYGTLALTITTIQVLVLVARAINANGNIRGTNCRRLVRLFDPVGFKQNRKEQTVKGQAS